MHVYSREAKYCKLADLAAKWAVTRVRCFALDKTSIRIAGEIANLSTGCEGLVHQFALATGVPYICHVRDLGKSVSVTLPGGKIVHRTLCWPMSSHHCDSHVSSAEDSTSGGEESTTMGGGMHPAPPEASICLGYAFLR